LRLLLARDVRWTLLWPGLFDTAHTMRCLVCNFHSSPPPNPTRIQGVLKTFDELIQIGVDDEETFQWVASDGSESSLATTAVVLRGFDALADATGEELDIEDVRVLPGQLQSCRPNLLQSCLLLCEQPWLPASHARF
jgi:hypothetical protein